VLFAFPSEMKSRLQKEGERGSFYCPNGHGQHYQGESDEAKIKRLTREAAAARQQAEAEAESARYAWRQADEAQKEAKKLRREQATAKRRAAAAVCPVPGCKRSIIQMQRHLSSKHPEWVEHSLHSA
jgi:hypothetical protein